MYTNMENLTEFCRDNIQYVVGALVVVGTSALVLKKLTSRRKPRVCGVDYPRDTVIVHQWTPHKFVPSLGHFVMKLETYLRMAKIPYKPCHDNDLKGAPKSKIPWIEYNGITMADSQMIINYLNKEFKVDLNSHLSPHDRAVAWGIQKWIEEFTYWLNAYIRWYTFGTEMMSEYISVPWYAIPFMKRKMKNIGHTVGVGRHSDEEIGEMIKNDLTQLSNILGTKKYLMGDRPTELDSAAFGILVQIRYATPDGCPGKQLLKGELKNVAEYLDRIKDEFWPDWNDRLESAS